jgi:predicted MFS family arabinose efflux permease
VLLVVCVSFAGSPAATLLPVMAATVLRGGPVTLGVLTASIGLGALGGAVLVGMRQRQRHLARTMGLGAALYGLALAAFSQSPWLALSAPLLAIAGGGIMGVMTAGNAILLSETEEDKRGRVMSVFTLSSMGTAPLGALCAGILAERLGAPATIALGAAGCLLGAAWFALATSR